MEIDILNDLLNRTISNLFTNKEKHLLYFSNEEEEYLSDDMKGKNEKDLSHTQVIQHGTFENIINKNKIIEEKKEEENITPEIWRNTIGKTKFENSMNKLNLDEKKIKNRQLYNLTLEVLQKEKAKVKNELKKYNSDFNEVFNHLPTKQDKEIMKPLYIYYKNLKNAIEKKEEDRNAITTLNQNYNQNTYSVISTNSNNDNKFNTNYFQNNILNQKSGFNYHKKANSTSLQNNNNNNNNNDIKEKKRSLSKDEMNALEREYKDIKKEQKDLKDKLRNYQNEFQKSNNRKVKFLKDITPVDKSVRCMTCPSLTIAAKYQSSASWESRWIDAICI